MGDEERRRERLDKLESALGPTQASCVSSRGEGEGKEEEEKGREASVGPLAAADVPGQGDADRLRLVAGGEATVGPRGRRLVVPAHHGPQWPS